MPVPKCGRPPTNLPAQSLSPPGNHGNPINSIPLPTATMVKLAFLEIEWNKWVKLFTQNYHMIVYIVHDRLISNETTQSSVLLSHKPANPDILLTI